MSKVTGGRLIVDALLREGTEYIFSLSGGHINPIYKACLDTGLKVVDTRHEQAAAHMAEAVGRLTKKPGVCVVTAGPGFTDAITGIANAFQSNTPMVIISGRSGVSETETLALQELEAINIIKPLVKWSIVCYETHRLDEFTAIAFRHATTGRPGPVFLEVPIDVMAAEIDEKKAVRPDGYRPQFKPAGSPDGIRQALELLSKAKNPAIIAGSGAYYADAEDRLAKFCEMTDIPVFTHFMGRGLLANGSPHGMGPLMTGIGVLPQTDVIMILGGRIGLLMGYGRPPFIPADAKVIQVDIDGTEIGRNRKIDVGIVGDVNEVLRQMINHAGSYEFAHKEWLGTASGIMQTAEGMIGAMFPGLDNEEPIHPGRMMREISEYLDDDAIVVADGGDASVWSMLMMETKFPGGHLSSGVFGCLGVGIPFGLAAKLLHPEKQVVVTMGDGSAALNLMEFNTAVRFNLPIVMAISNDSSWGMIRHGQKSTFGEGNLVGCELGEVAYEKVVEALGGYGERVDKASDIKGALERAFASGKPACLNIYTDRDIGTPFAQALARLGTDEDTG